MFYSDDLRLKALKLLEKEIVYKSYQYNIIGYDPEDIAQELRLHIWKKFNPRLYNPHICSIRTWGNILMRRRLTDLSRTQKYDKRKILFFVEPFIEKEN